MAVSDTGIYFWNGSMECRQTGRASFGAVRDDGGGIVVLAGETEQRNSAIYEIAVDNIVCFHRVIECSDGT